MAGDANVWLRSDGYIAVEWIGGPFLTVTAHQVDDLLDALAEKGWLTRYGTVRLKDHLA